MLEKIEDYFTVGFKTIYDAQSESFRNDLIDWCILHNQDLSKSMLKLLLRKSNTKDIVQRTKEYEASRCIKRVLIDITPDVVQKVNSRIESLDGTMLKDTVYHFCETYKIFDPELVEGFRRPIYTGVKRNSRHEKMFTNILNADHEKKLNVMSAFAIGTAEEGDVPVTKKYIFQTLLVFLYLSKKVKNKYKFMTM